MTDEEYDRLSELASMGEALSLSEAMQLARYLQTRGLERFWAMDKSTLASTIIDFFEAAGVE